MEITQQIRDHAAERGLSDEQAVEAGPTQKSEAFHEAGGESDA